jgi:hypothetical protein
VVRDVRRLRGVGDDDGVIRQRAGERVEEGQEAPRVGPPREPVAQRRRAGRAVAGGRGVEAVEQLRPNVVLIDRAVEEIEEARAEAAA